MTSSQTQVEFKSALSDLSVVPGWRNLLSGVPDAIEVQLGVESRDQGRPHACLLIEYWPEQGAAEPLLQNVMPFRTFNGGKQWCLFLPGQGRLQVRVIDLAPSPPFLGAQWFDLAQHAVPGEIRILALTAKVPLPGSA